MPRQLREALTVASDTAFVEHALGLLFVRHTRLPEGTAALRRAAELRPDLPCYAYVYGVALHSSGDLTGALDVLAEAHERHPENRDLLVALATMHRDDGSLEMAFEFATKLVDLSPRDPDARQLLEQLEAGRP